MSTNRLRGKRKARTAKPGLRPGSAAAVAVLLLLMAEPSAVIASMRQALRLCAGTVVPSLFPFLVASELLVRSGAGERMANRVAKPICRLFGVSRCGAVAYIMGVLCGFPIGAKTAAAYAQRGKISSGELEQLLCFGNVPSAAFLIHAVGVSLYGDACFGRVLWSVALVAAALCGVLYRWMFHGRDPIAAPEPIRPIDPADSDSHEKNSVSAALIGAANGMISVVATVLFFGALLGALGALLSHGRQELDAGTTARMTTFFSALVAALFELTGGVARAAALLQENDAWLRAVSPLLCAAAVGWGGLSVQYQLLSACETCRMRVRRGRFFLFRALQALLCCLGVTIWLRVR